MHHKLTFIFQWSVGSIEFHELSGRAVKKLSDYKKSKSG